MCVWETETDCTVHVCVVRGDCDLALYIHVLCVGRGDCVLAPKNYTCVFVGRGYRVLTLINTVHVCVVMGD